MVSLLFHTQSCILLFRRSYHVHYPCNTNGSFFPVQVQLLIIWYHKTIVLLALVQHRCMEHSLLKPGSDPTLLDFQTPSVHSARFPHTCDVRYNLSSGEQNKLIENPTLVVKEGSPVRRMRTSKADCAKSHYI